MAVIASITPEPAAAPPPLEALPGRTRDLVPGIVILAFIASFACSLGPIPWIMIAEIFPTRIRGAAMSLCILSLWLAVVAVTQFTPILLDPVAGLGGAFTFWLFMLFSILLLIFVWKAVPETKQRTLEEIEQSWTQP